MSLHAAWAAPHPDVPVIFGYGLGLDSTAILVRWLLEPHTRPFDLDDWVVLTAQTGSEWPETGRLVEEHIYPLLRAHGIRTVQVARAGPSQRDGIVVLDDTRAPRRCHIAGAYTLAEEMLTAGTVPQAGGSRLCSIKAKGWCLDSWIEDYTRGRPFRHVIGFESEELRRAERDAKLGRAGRIPVYPLIEWGWNRQMCDDYLYAHLGVRLGKSACNFCPFGLTNTVSRARSLARYIAEPSQAMLPLLMEHVAVALNPRQGLIAGARLIDALAAEETAAPLLARFEDHLNAQPWALYDVRRAFRADKNDDQRSAGVVRALTRLAEGTRRQILANLDTHAEMLRLPIEFDGLHERIWLQHREKFYPCVEHALVAAPAVVADKIGPGFTAAWQAGLAGAWKAARAA